MKTNAPTDSPTTSFWEDRQFFPLYDLVIIGSGLVGLSAALAARRRQPDARIAVLEKGVLPTGASTRNAGFGCFGSPSELLDDLQQMPEDQVWEVVARRWEGLRLLREEVGDRQLGLKAYGGYEVFLEGDVGTFEQVLDHLPAFNERFYAITGKREAMKPVRPAWAGKEMRVSEVIHLPFECQLDPARMMKSLLDRCRGEGITVFQGVTVEDFQPFREGWEVATRPRMPIRTRRLLVATNGFTRRLLPDLEVMPARNQVLITPPLPGLFSWKGCFHYNRGYVYFRNVGDRILLGGFRHLDPDGETTDAFGLTDSIRTEQVRWLREVLLPDQAIEPAKAWSGILGVGPGKAPILQMLEPGLAVAVRLGGMGVALGSLLGREAIDLLYGSSG